jgi:hypothetical protein
VVVISLLSLPNIYLSFHIDTCSPVVSVESLTATAVASTTKLSLFDFVQLVRLTSLALVVVDYLGVSVLISVVIDCVVVLSCGLAPLQCTTPDLTKLAKLFLSDPSQSNNSQATIIVITLHCLAI